MEEFRGELRSKLQHYAETYKQNVSPEQHIANIRELASSLSTRYADILEGNLSFGIAAKALNTYLKSRWCADGTIQPTHCPFDDRVLKRIRPRKKRGQPSTFRSTWTDATEEHYREWVDLAEKVAGGVPLSEWELKLWQEAVAKERKKVRERLKPST